MDGYPSSMISPLRIFSIILLLPKIFLHGFEIKILPALPIRFNLIGWHICVGECDFCSTLYFFKNNLKMRIRRVVGEFRCPPGLHDALILCQLQCRAEDVSVPRRKFSADFAVHFCRTPRHCRMTFRAQPGFENFCRFGGNDCRNFESVFQFMSAFVFHCYATHARSAPRAAHCSTTGTNLRAWIFPWSTR